MNALEALQITLDGLQSKRQSVYNDELNKARNDCQTELDNYTLTKTQELGNATQQLEEECRAKKAMLEQACQADIDEKKSSIERMAISKAESAVANIDSAIISIKALISRNAT